MHMRLQRQVNYCITRPTALPLKANSYSVSQVCLFICLGLFATLGEFLLIWRRHYYRLRAAHVDLCSALMAIVQWVFFNVPYLLWHGASVYNGHFRWPVPLTPITERLAVVLSLPVLRLRCVVVGIRTINPPHARLTL